MANPTSAPSMNRVIHFAVRRDLERFRRALDAFTEGDRERAAGLHRAWSNFDAHLTEHHEGEHEIVWPMLEAIGVPVPTIDTFDSEHDAMAADLAKARVAMDRLRDRPGSAEAAAAAAAVAQLQATTVTHLDHEEAELEPVLARHEDHPAVKEMGKRFRQRSGLTETGTFLAWVQDGATEEELAALHAHVPRPVVAVIGGVFGRRYRSEVAPVWSA